MQQQRFVLALVISAAILLGWGYLFPVKPPIQNNANNSTVEQPAAATQPAPATPVSSSQQTASQTETNLPSSDTTPQRTLTIKTPLYDVKFDSRGAVPVSWIIKKNKDSGRSLYSVAGDKNNPKPLELLSSEGQKQNELPLRLLTEDANLNVALTSKNYQITGIDSNESDAVIDLASGAKRFDFVLHDEASALTATKSFNFTADSYNVEMSGQISRNGEAIPQAKLVIGPSIGDQGIPQYNFYSVAPEGTAFAGGEVHRLAAVAIHKNDGGWFSSKRPEGADREIVNGSTDWAGVGDTYFTMVAVPPKATEGLEYQTKSYEHEANGKKEERYLVKALLPIPLDGSPTQLYVGPKDHNLLKSGSEQIHSIVNRNIDLEGTINYGFLSGMRRFLAVPILKSINFIQSITGSYGFSIILFTAFIYSLFFPLKWRSSKAMKKAQKLAPRMKELQEKIKGMKQDDPRLKELQVEQLRLMKEGNPLGGCLPLLIQMPFFFALYTAITISLDFRQASFLWIPDLSAAEPNFIHILPILMAGSMVFVQLITPAPSADPLQRKMMAIGMPVFMLWILWSAPAGLVIYWLVGNIVGFGQQFIINRLTKTEDDDEPPKAEDKKVDRQSPKSPKKLRPARVSQT
jgi:YidC/Oxa1 family membrane protein insertase